MDRTWTDTQAAGQAEKNKRPFQKRRAKEAQGVLQELKIQKKTLFTLTR